MRNFRRVAWSAAAAFVAASSPALAQQTSTGGNIGNATTQTSALPASTNTNNTNTSSTPPGSSSTLPGSSSTPQSSFQAASTLQPPSKTTTNNTAISASNFLRNTYSSVYYQGADPSQVLTRNPGSFGTALYPQTGANAARGGNQTTTRGGAGTLTDPGGQIVTLPRQIAYSSQIHFKMPAGNPLPQLQADLRGAIDRVPTSMLTNPAGVQVNVDGRNVTLKGNVRDEEESRLVEGLVRLTPGVFAIKNDLTVAK